jgi:hypothetical protein
LRKKGHKGIIHLPMTQGQEEALYDFLDSVTDSFELDEVVSFIHMIEPKRKSLLAQEVESYINSRNMAFLVRNKCWMSRRGFFAPLSFVISPSRLELVNGILIPGHRCVPFANTGLLPHEYIFSWQGSTIPHTTTEGPPEEFYPYYNILGEEYAPQYVAKDNSENEEAFNGDPFDDPPEVSIRTIDMRNIYREASFVPGDRFVARTLDWKLGSFELEKVSKDEWSAEDLDAWLLSAEEGFEKSFSKLGPGSCTEEQIAYAYWYGSPRMREVPAYSLEDYIYEKTNRIETSAYGIETRFWYAGREIPDRKELDLSAVISDMTPVVLLLQKNKIPVSRYVIQSYVLDSLFRENGNAELILERLVPARVEMEGKDKVSIFEYIKAVLDEYRAFYTPFTDKVMGPIRARAGELHTAVIELASKLNKGDFDISWLPRHTFIILSQIQMHTAGVMEDLASSDTPSEAELEALDNSLDSMIETYEEVKELIDEALESFRRNRIAVIRSGSEVVTERLLQLSIGGTDTWRRIIVPEYCSLGDLHKIVRTVFGWSGTEAYKFSAENGLVPKTTIKELEEANIVELLYEYGTKWNVRVIILSRQDTPGPKPVRCVAGAGAAPPEFIPGPVKYRRLLYALESGNDAERQGARQEVGPDFVPGEFDLEACNKLLGSITLFKSN